jgi:hypothetical protein
MENAAVQSFQMGRLEFAILVKKARNMRVFDYERLLYLHARRRIRKQASDELSLPVFHSNLPEKVSYCIVYIGFTLIAFDSCPG